MNNLVSGFIGALIAIMILFNGTLSNHTGNYTSSVLIHSIGLIGVVITLLITKSKFNLQKNIPLYLYSAGAIGFCTIIFNNISFPVLGVSLTLALGLLGQALASIVIDHFGLLGMKSIHFEKKKLIGLTLVSLGVLIMTLF